jgi:hypothetical protein
MDSPVRQGTRHGFVMVELIAVGTLALVALTLLVVASSDMRRKARVASDLSKLGEIAAVTQSYAADHEDRVWSFSWRKTGPSSGQPTRFYYQPHTWDPPTSTGAFEEALHGCYYRYTRNGIAGRDLGGS